MASGRILLMVIGVVACTGPEPAFAQGNPWRVPDYGQASSGPSRQAYDQDYPGSNAPNRASPSGDRRRRDNFASRTPPGTGAAGRTGSGQDRRYGSGSNGYGNSARGAAPASPYLGRFGFAPPPPGNPRSGYRDGRVSPGRQARPPQGRGSGRPRPEQPRTRRSYNDTVRGRFVPSIGRDSFEPLQPGNRDQGFGDYPPLHQGPVVTDQTNPLPARRYYPQPSWPSYGVGPAYPRWRGAGPGFSGPSTFANPYGGTYGGLPGGYGNPGGLGLPGGFGMPFF